MYHIRNLLNELMDKINIGLVAYDNNGSIIGNNNKIKTIALRNKRFSFNRSIKFSSRGDKVLFTKAFNLVTNEDNRNNEYTLVLDKDNHPRLDIHMRRYYLDSENNYIIIVYFYDYETVTFDTKILRLFFDFSIRQAEIVTLLLQGHRQKEIATKLNISTAVCSNDLQKALGKVKVQSTTQLCIKVMGSLCFLV